MKSIFPPPYESKNANQVYHDGTKPIFSEYVERISAFALVSQKFGNNLRFLQIYQLYQISTLPKFTLLSRLSRIKKKDFRIVDGVPPLKTDPPPTNFTN